MKCLVRWLMSLATLSAGVAFLAAWYHSKNVKTSSCRLETGLNLTSKVVVVTGASSGIGFQIALELARRGARVVMGCRDRTRGEAARKRIVEDTGSKSVAVIGIDLASMKKVHKFYDKLVEMYGRVDVLVNNAAVGLPPAHRHTTYEGLEATVAVNHLGPQYLSQLVMPILTDGGKIITVSCDGNLFSDPVDPTDLNSEKVYRPEKLYNRTKLLNIMMARKLATVLKAGQASYSLDPGVTWTNLYVVQHGGKRHLSPSGFGTIDEVATGALQHGAAWLRWLVGPLMHGAGCPTLSWQTAVWLAGGGTAALEEKEEGSLSGGHFYDCGLVKHVNSEAADSVVVDKVWEASYHLIESAFV